MSTSSTFNVLKNGKVGKYFDESIKKFARTLHFYSPRAYKYVRDYFSNKLPCVRTIQKWYEVVDGQPGITVEALNAITRKCESQQGKKIYGCLMLDEMAIRTKLDWDKFNEKFTGGTTSIDDDDEERREFVYAREVLVFMIVAVNQHWKVSVGYYFVNGLSATDKKALTLRVIERLRKTGIEIIAITSDGPSVNIAMYKMLGASFVRDDFRPFFIHDHKKIHIFLDVCHCMKLVRNTFAKYDLLNESQEEIKWQFIEKLHDLQEEHGLHLKNKIGKNHVYFDNTKMVVKYAVQVLSESVSCAIKHLAENRKMIEFQHSEATVEFLNIFNNIFDILNSNFCGGYLLKRPVSKLTKFEYLEILEKTVGYIDKLSIISKDNSLNQYTVKNILESRNFTGFLGIKIACVSLSNIIAEYIDTDKLSLIQTRKFSQDHLETFFSAVRSRGGFNNNPCTKLFTATYKKLLFHSSEIIINSNCKYDKRVALLNCVPIAPDVAESPVNADDMEEIILSENNLVNILITSKFD